MLDLAKVQKAGHPHHRFSGADHRFQHALDFSFDFLFQMFLVIELGGGHLDGGRSIDGSGEDLAVTVDHGDGLGAQPLHAAGDKVDDPLYLSFGEPLAGQAIRRALPAGDDGASSAGSVSAPSIAAIQDTVASVLGITKAELLSAGRAPRVARARQLAMYLARELTPLSLAQIAREFNRDHSTVIHAVRAVEGRNEPGSDVAGDINRVRGLLRNVSGGPVGEQGGAH